MRTIIFGMTLLSIGLLGPVEASPLREVPGTKHATHDEYSHYKHKKNKAAKVAYEPVRRQIPGTSAQAFAPAPAAHVGLAPRPAQPVVHREIPGGYNSIEPSSLVTASIGIAPALSASIGIAPACKSPCIQRIIPGTRTQQIVEPVVIQQAPIVISRQPVAQTYVTPVSMSDKKNILELSDGSLWRIRRRHRHIARSWCYGDAIGVEVRHMPNGPQYQLINYTRGEAVEVKYPIERQIRL